MLKTIKTTKQLRLDELLKLCWDNNVNEKRVFLGNHGQRVVFDDVGGFYPSGYAYSPDSTFTVEVEEEITEDTEFEFLVEVSKIDRYYFVEAYYNHKLDHVIDDDTEFIYTFINGKPELIYEVDNYEKE